MGTSVTAWHLDSHTQLCSTISCLSHHLSYKHHVWLHSCLGIQVCSHTHTWHCWIHHHYCCIHSLHCCIHSLHCCIHSLHCCIHCCIHCCTHYCTHCCIHHCCCCIVGGNYSSCYSLLPATQRILCQADPLLVLVFSSYHSYSLLILLQGELQRTLYLFHQLVFFVFFHTHYCHLLQVHH